MLSIRVVTATAFAALGLVPILARAQGALLAEELEAVDVLVASVVAGVGLALWLRLGVEVVEGGGGGGGLVVVCGGETS